MLLQIKIYNILYKIIIFLIRLKWKSIFYPVNFLYSPQYNVIAVQFKSKSYFLIKGYFTTKTSFEGLTFNLINY